MVREALFLDPFSRDNSGYLDLDHTGNDPSNPLENTSFSTQSEVEDRTLGQDLEFSEC